MQHVQHVQEMRHAYNTFVTKHEVRIPLGGHKWKPRIETGV
jgi:hypothetical protein